MGWRNLLIETPCELSVRQGSLIFRKEEGESLPLPLADLDCIIIEHPQVKISAKTLSRLADEKIQLVTTDAFHLPNGAFMPVGRHSRQLKVIQAQLSLTKPFKKRLWQAVIKQKISNQADILQQYNLDSTSRSLRQIRENVQSGDTTNREAYAASIYFKSLFGPTFVRRDDDVRNSALNYGYAIFRSYLARQLVSYGFLPYLGIFHENELNNFNLADDFLEPFRPLVDWFVKEHIATDQLFDKNSRHSLVQLLGYNVQMNRKTVSCAYAM